MQSGKQQEKSRNRAEVILADGEAALRSLGRYYFEKAGYAILAEIATIDEAVSITPWLVMVRREEKEKGECATLFGIVEENLSPGRYDGMEGEKIAEILRAKLPDIVIINYSTSCQKEFGDCNIRKPDSFDIIVKACDQILEGQNKNNRKPG
ncbi:MAG: hypothetical protein M1383_04255 [Patescibacteria group bacterium]|nr:hypothetical protein [Patescibacteria group bacterium]